MRLMTAAYLKSHQDQFQPFIEGISPGSTVEKFCATEVEPMGKECDQPQIEAITQALEVSIQIEYLDSSSDREKPQSYKFFSEQKPSVYLLYRPGHYDIIYPKEHQ